MKATVTTQTSKVNVNSYSDDVLIHPKRTSVGISVPNATGGGSYVEKDFRTLTISPNVTAGNVGEYLLDGGKQFFLLGYTATVEGVRIRGYADETSRDNDLARPLNQDPLIDSGVLFELVTQIGTYRFSMPVTCYAETSMPLLVESQVSVSSPISFLIY